jgi:hypothetical protein
MTKRIRPAIVGDRHTRLDNGTNWPLPDGDPFDRFGANHIVRYAPIEQVAEVRFHAASVMDAYETLLLMPLSQSREVLRALKLAMAERNKDKP